MDRVNAFLHRLIPPTRAPSVRPGTSRTHEPVLLAMRNTPAPDGYAESHPHTAAKTETPVDPLAPYEMPPEHATVLVDLLNETRRALDPDYAMSLSSSEQAALEHFYSTRTALLESITSGNSQPLPVSASVRAWPDISDCRSQQKVLKRILGASPGVIIAEAHWMRSSKRLLSDHPETLRRLGVDTLYLEHLQTIHQSDLDRHHQTGRMSPALNRFLAQQDAGHMTDVRHRGGFLTLVKEAQRAGIRVVALDLMTSYNLRGASFADAGNQDETALRVRVFNAVAAQRIAHDQRLRATQRATPTGTARRWIALMGNSHAGSFNGIAGVADRLGVPSVRMEDAGEGQRALHAGFDPGRTVQPRALVTGGDVQCDYLVKVPCPGYSGARTAEPCTAAEARVARQLRVAMGHCSADLHSAGSYRLVEIEPNQHALVHRSGKGELVAQRVVQVPGGGVRLQLAEEAHPGRWKHMDRPFPDLLKLKAALDTLLDEVPPASPTGATRSAAIV